MKKLTYKEAFDKITEAYIKGEIEPMEMQFCFCGTLSPNKDWHIQKEDAAYPYSIDEYQRMEDALFKRLNKLNTSYAHWEEIPTWETILFNAMCDALKVLKKIHKERNEDVEDFQFAKRSIQQIKETV